MIGVFEEELRGRRVVGLGLGARRLGILFDGWRLGWQAKAYQGPPKTRWTTLWRGRAWGEYFREHGSNSNADNATSFVRSNNAGVAAAAAAGRRQQSQQSQQLQ